MYVIKTDYGAFFVEHSNKKEINLRFTSLERVKHITLDEAHRLEKKYKEQFNRLNCKIYKIQMTAIEYNK